MLSLGKPKLKKKNRPVPPVPCKRKVEACKFLSVQRFVRTRVNGARRSKIRPVPTVQCKRKVEPCKFLSVQRFVLTRVNGACRSKIRPVPPVTCKRKVEPCKFLSVQRFARTRENGASAVQKFVQFRRSHVNTRWNRVKICSDPCKRGLRPRLHGSGQIFARTSFVPGPPVYMDPCKFCCSGVYTDPCKV